MGLFKYLLLVHMFVVGILAVSGCNQDSPSMQEKGSAEDQNQVQDKINRKDNPSLGAEIVREDPKKVVDNSGGLGSIDQAPLLQDGGFGGGSGGVGSAARGSQGSVQEAITGNPDAGFIGPDGECGNNIQEQSPNRNSPCIYSLYATTSPADDEPSSLYAIDPETGTGILIGNILEESVGVNRILALDFSPSGQLYGVGYREDNDLSVLLQIDCVSSGGGVKAVIVGPTNVESEVTDEGIDTWIITDIDFDPMGRLFAYLDTDPRPEFLGMLNIASGQWTTIGEPNTASPGRGHGIASAPFPTSSLYHANDVDLSTLSTLDATTTTVSNIVFSPPIDGQYARINGMDYDIFNNLTFVSVLDTDMDGPGPQVSYVGTIGRENGVVSFLPLGPNAAPDYLQSIAVNQRYEECDGSLLTISAANAEIRPTALIVDSIDCNEECELIELNCLDSEDNDYDGLVDCEDPDCDQVVCDDGTFCTQGDTCIDRMCVGVENCNDYNPCTIDSCGGEACTHELDESKTVFGGCEQDGRSCTIGRCIEDDIGPGQWQGGSLGAKFMGNNYICEEIDRALLGPEDMGCKDENQCSADSCIEIPIPRFGDDDDDDDGPAIPNVSWGDTSNRDSDGNVILDNNFQCSHETMEFAPCFAELACLPGICTIIENLEDDQADPFTIECVQENEGNPQIFCPDIDNNSCTVETCEVGVGCVSNNVDPQTECNDYDPCTVDDLCQTDPWTTDFYCFGQPKIKIPEEQGGGDDNNFCTVDMCQDGMISHMPITGPSQEQCVPQIGNQPPCGNGVRICVDGQETQECEPLANPPEEGDLCIDNIDNDCDGLVDLDDPDCDFLYAFVSSIEVQGNMMVPAGPLDSCNNFAGVNRADCICRTLAQVNGIPDIQGKFFRAWLSTSTVDAKDRINAEGRGYKLTNNTPLVLTFDDLLVTASQDLLNSISIQEDGSAVVPDNSFDRVWTDTLGDGTKSTHPNSTACSDWSTNDFAFDAATIGTSTEVNRFWTNNDAAATCDNFERIYCFEVLPL